MTENDKTQILRSQLNRAIASDADFIMIQRLDDIVRGTLEMTDTDRRFYAHSLRVLERFQAMGIADDIPNKNPFFWNNAHTAALEDCKLSDDESLRYTKEAIEAAKRQELWAFETIFEMKISMTAVEQIVKLESVRDLLSVLAISLVFPSIDRLFGRYRFDVIANGELIRTYQRLFEENVLAECTGTVAIPGPNWAIPKFVSDRKHI